MSTHAADLVSFLICTLVVGVSLFFASLEEPSNIRVAPSALLLGTGIVSMHYVGVHGLAGWLGFAIYRNASPQSLRRELAGIRPVSVSGTHSLAA